MSEKIELDYNYETIIKLILELNPIQIYELTTSLNNYEKIKNKSEKDNLFIKFIALRGYKSLTEFYNEQKITKDNAMSRVITEKSSDLEAMIKLKNILWIDNETFCKYLQTKINGGDEE